MSIVEVRRLVWEEIIAEVKLHWDLLVLINDKKIAIHEFKTQLQARRREGEEKATMAKKLNRYLNEVSPQELRAQGIHDRFRTILGVGRVIEKKLHARIRWVVWRWYQREWRSSTKSGASW